MSDEASKFDPRFDPAFQRGFDGATTAVPREKLQPTAPVSQPVTPREPDAAASAPAEPATAPTRERMVIEPTDELLDDEPESRRLNPFLIALLAAGVLLIGGGLYLISRLGDLFANPSESSQYDYITLQAMTIAAPMLIVLGIATGVGVLFIYAVRWGRK